MVNYFGVDKHVFHEKNKTKSKIWATFHDKWKQGDENEELHRNGVGQLGRKKVEMPRKFLLKLK